MPLARRRSTPYAVLAALWLATPVLAAEPAATPTREHFAPRGMERSYHDYHYSPVVKVGDMVIVSGIPAGPGKTYEEQIRGLFERHPRSLVPQDPCDQDAHVDAPTQPGFRPRSVQLPQERRLHGREPRDEEPSAEGAVEGRAGRVDRIGATDVHRAEPVDRHGPVRHLDVAGVDELVYGSPHLDPAAVDGNHTERDDPVAPCVEARQLEVEGGVP